VKSTFFWDITPCSPFKVNRLFGGTYRLHLQGREISRARNQRESRRQAERYIPEDSTLHNHRCDKLRSYMCSRSSASRIISRIFPLEIKENTFWIQLSHSALHLYFSVHCIHFFGSWFFYNRHLLCFASTYFTLIYIRLWENWSSFVVWGREYRSELIRAIFLLLRFLVIQIHKYYS
jgi:hypothetical protein